MEDTTDKSSAPEGATDETAQGAPLTDKDLGQADQNTGVTQDETESSPENGTSEDGSERTEESEQPKEEEAAEEGSDSEEGQLLTPEQVKTLPPELKAQYSSMKQAFDQKMGIANDLIEKARDVLSKGDKTSQGEEVPPARQAVEVALKRRGLDPKSLSAEHLQSLELMAEIALEGGQEGARKVAAPLEQREAMTQVNSYFEKYPDREKYRKEMGALDAQTGGKLPLDTLYYAASGQDREKAATERKEKKYRDLSKGNSDSATGATGKGQGEEDPFEQMMNAGGRGNSVLR